MQAVVDAALRKLAHRLSASHRLDQCDQQALLSLPCELVSVRGHADVSTNAGASFLVIEGLLGRVGQLKNGRRQIAAMYVPGDLVDLQSVILSDAESRFNAHCATSLLQIPTARLRALAFSHPAIARALWREQARDASIICERALSLGRRTALERLAHLVCEIGVRMEQAGLGTRHEYELPATQEDLADALGLTGVHLNRTLKVLEGEGAASRRGRMCVVEDWEALKRIGDFDAQYLHLPAPSPLAETPCAGDELSVASQTGQREYQLMSASLQQASSAAPEVATLTSAHDHVPELVVGGPGQA